MKSLAGNPTRTVLVLVVAAAVIAVAVLSSSNIATPKTVTNTSISTSTVVRTSSLTVTDVVISNQTITVNLTKDRPYALIINPSATVRGEAVSIPSCAVDDVCTSSANQSSTAALILYGGGYYYISNYTLAGQVNQVYTIWYTNSTEYCVSPEVSGDRVCPNVAFISETPLRTETSQSTSCTVTGEGGPLFVQVVTDYGLAVQGQQIQVLQEGPTVNGQQCGTASIQTLTTNSTGWVQVPSSDNLPYAGSFVVSFVYSGQTYNATITIYPVTATYVTFYVPSGVEATVTCPDDSCPTYSDSMTMGD